MNIALVVSMKDPAGLNIKNNLISNFPFKQAGEFKGNPVYSYDNCRLYTVQDDSIHCEDLDMEISADLFIFATKHQSASGIPSLSVHPPGNWGVAELGGRNKSLCTAPAAYLKLGLLKLNELARGEDFEVIQECTHHGPFMKKPCMFIEIGSSEKQWNDTEAGHIIAEAITYLVGNPPSRSKAVLGIGGLHHTPNFKKIITNTEYAVGHVCPKYMLKELDKRMVQQAIARTCENVEKIVLDWKGLGSEKDRIVEMLGNLGLEHCRTKDL